MSKTAKLVAVGCPAVAVLCSADLEYWISGPRSSGEAALTYQKLDVILENTGEVIDVAE